MYIFLNLKKIQVFSVNIKTHVLMQYTCNTEESMLLKTAKAKSKSTVTLSVLSEVGKFPCNVDLMTYHTHYR